MTYCYNFNGLALYCISWMLKAQIIDRIMHIITKHLTHWVYELVGLIRFVYNMSTITTMQMKAF